MRLGFKKHELHYRFPDNFILMKAENEYNAVVVWVTDLELEDKTGGDVSVVGHVFRSMQPSWETGSDDFARFHSYLVSNLDKESTTFKGSQMIGKGIALHLNIDVEHPRILNFEQEWIFHLLDHCLPR